MDISLIIVGAAVVLIVIVLLVSTLRKARGVSLNENTDDEPERMQSTPPAEIAPKTGSDDEQAAPFVEQFEDILKENLEADEYLSQYKVDLGATPDGGIEIWVNGEMYTDVKSLPDERLRQAFQEAVDQWNKG